MNPIYLDHNATTALDSAARDEMLTWLGDKFGNPSSVHSFGQKARDAVYKARAQTARLIGAHPEEIVFTSGGTEANNLAILGAVAASGRARPHLVTTTIEHQAVLNPCLHIEKTGCGSITFAPVDHHGLSCPDAVLSSLRDDTLLVSAMLANNDIGTVQPVSALSKQVRERSILLHTDAVQAVGKIEVDVNTLGVDLLSFSGHKIHGPQGTGALYVRKGTRLRPLTFGGHQERGLRPGTENVAAIIGFGKACELANERLAADAERALALRSSFEAAIVERVPGVIVNGHGAPRLPNTTNLSFDSLDGEALVFSLDMMGLAASTGAACSSADNEPSHVLMAMGRTPAQARSSVRFSFGRENTGEDVARAVSLIVQVVEQMRKSRRSATLPILSGEK
jgi:cysteine desulfurase